MNELIAEQKSFLIYTSINDLMYVPVNVTSIELHQNRYTIFAKRHYKDYDKNFSERVTTSLNAYVIQSKISPYYFEVMDGQPESISRVEYNKIMIYGTKEENHTLPEKFADNYVLFFLNHYSIDSLDEKEIETVSIGKKNMFMNQTTCSGDIWARKDSGEIYFGVKYKRPEYKNPPVEHYYRKSDYLRPVDGSNESIIKEVKMMTGLNDFSIGTAELFKIFDQFGGGDIERKT